MGRGREMKREEGSHRKETGKERKGYREAQHVRDGGLRSVQHDVGNAYERHGLGEPEMEGRAGVIIDRCGFV